MRRRLIENDGRYANGVYIQTVDGKLYTKAEWEDYKPTDGVYIESVDGDLYTRSQWNALADKPQVNGVTVVNGSRIFTVSLQDSTSQLTWQVVPYAINYITYKSNENEARSDFEGFENSSFINDRGSGCAANYYCKTFQFQNEQYGYLGSMGEMSVMLQNKGEVNECLSIIGGTLLDSYVYWTSTANSLYASWYIDAYTGAAGIMDNDQPRYVRPLTPAKKYTPKGVAVVADEIIFVIGLNDSPRSLAWQTTSGDITGLSNITALNIVRENFNGKLNSDIIAAASNGGDNSPANSYCQKYIFSDGSQGYLPSCGELYVAFQNKVVINEFLNLVGSAFNASNFYWSSSEYGSSIGWGISFYEGSINTFDKITSGYVRPFGVFDA